MRGMSYPEAKAELKRLIRESVKRQMVSDVPYGMGRFCREASTAR